MTLEELIKICDRATPGPWRYDHGNWYVEDIDRQTICQLNQLTKEILDSDGCFKCHEILNGNPSDGEFIEASRKYMPILIEVAKAVLKNPEIDLDKLKAVRM